LSREIRQIGIGGYSAILEQREDMQ